MRRSTVRFRQAAPGKSPGHTPSWGLWPGLFSCGAPIGRREPFEHMYDWTVGMDVVERWWNGGWGRLAENVWLAREGCWHVVVRRGDTATGTVLRWEYA